MTGGGIEGNTRRILSDTLDLSVDWGAWERLPVFTVIKDLGKVPEDDMRQAFNLGIGLVFILPEIKADELINVIKNYNMKYYNIGKII